MSGYISNPSGFSDVIYQNLGIINQRIISVISNLRRNEAEAEITLMVQQNNWQNKFYDNIVNKVCAFMEYGFYNQLPFDSMLNNELPLIVTGIYATTIVNNTDYMRMIGFNSGQYQTLIMSYNQLVNKVNAWVEYNASQQQMQFQQQQRFSQPQSNLNFNTNQPGAFRPALPSTNNDSFYSTQNYNNYTRDVNSYGSTSGAVTPERSYPQQRNNNWGNNNQPITRDTWSEGNTTTVNRYTTSSQTNFAQVAAEANKNSKPVTIEGAVNPETPVIKSGYRHNSYTDFLKTYPFPYNIPAAMIEPKPIGFIFGSNDKLEDVYMIEENTMDFKHHDLTKFFEPEFEAEKSEKADPAETRRAIAKMQQQISYESLVRKFAQKRENVEVNDFSYDKMVTLSRPILGDYPNSPLSYFGLLQESSEYKDLFEVAGMDIYQTAVNFNVVNYTGIDFDDKVAELAKRYQSAKTMIGIRDVMNQLLDEEYESVSEVIRLQNRILTRVINHVLANVLDLKVIIDSFNLDIEGLEKILATKYNMKGALDLYATQLANSLFKPVSHGNRYYEFLFSGADCKVENQNTFLFITNAVLLPIHSGKISFNGSNNRAYLTKIPGQDSVLYDAIDNWYTQREEIAYRSVVVTLDNRVIEVIPAKMRGTYLLMESKL